MFTFNWQYAAYFLLILLVEIYIGVFVHDDFVRPYIGDVLVVVLIYFFLRMLYTQHSLRLPIYVCTFAIVIEFGQYFHLVRLLNLEDYTLARVIIGSTFDWFDIVCYLSGMILLLLWQTWEKR